ncbi:hypothetical protein F5B22DRAFT_618023 [Xylaria bambusicola]|uniref:uncharacterized protein n=1 Tax=Xylaria bambusicola TaxID=326684 RepID=UPI0020079A9F|nr:uncharacterized protein F5B22DRAFT_618023 [Xylaria bambusicola]KAI0509197.1 hypothetical protein F5B22DRAFT_618023 [Xylaria bambusicola]
MRLPKLTLHDLRERPPVTVQATTMDEHCCTVVLKDNQAGSCDMLPATYGGSALSPEDRMTTTGTIHCSLPVSLEDTDIDLLPDTKVISINLIRNVSNIEMHDLLASNNVIPPRLSLDMDELAYLNHFAARTLNAANYAYLTDIEPIWDLSSLEFMSGRALRIESGDAQMYLWMSLTLGMGMVAIAVLVAIFWILIRLRQQLRCLATWPRAATEEARTRQETEPMPAAVELCEVEGDGIVREKPDDHKFIYELPVVPAELPTCA